MAEAKVVLEEVLKQIEKLEEKRDSIDTELRELYNKRDFALYVDNQIMTGKCYIKDWDFGNRSDSRPASEFYRIDKVEYHNGNVWYMTYLHIPSLSIQHLKEECRYPFEGAMLEVSNEEFMEQYNLLLDKLKEDAK